MNSELTTIKLSSGERKKAYINRKRCKEVDQIMKHYAGPIIMYDLETTGLSCLSDRIVQIAAVKLERNRKGQYRITDRINQYIKPPFPMPKGASDVNHITDDILKDAPDENEIFPIIDKFFLNPSTGMQHVVAGYRIEKFDNRMMDNLYKRHGRAGFIPENTLDVMQIAIELIDRADLEDMSFTQTNVAKLYGFEEDTMHDAFTDVWVSGKLLWHLYRIYLEQYKVPENYYDAMPKLSILGMYALKKSKMVNFIYVSVTATIQGECRSGRFCYDMYRKRFVEESGDLMELCDLQTFSKNADIYAGGSIEKYHSAKRRK